MKTAHELFPWYDYSTGKPVLDVNKWEQESKTIDDENKIYVWRYDADHDHHHNSMDQGDATFSISFVPNKNLLTLAECGFDNDATPIRMYAPDWDFVENIRMNIIKKE